ncbi:hypothetical protein [Rugamonas sp. DEMB1]|uniref:hypothetical protein n=1 Tax=Rugamonas sp. DEMB1 TaxID=3039386 RepID=UPI00244D249A|nr:hypothetical protein [Rugamonas sp. DEMB1]WGG49640.1 hypothetical protein QC826_24430 [Rugamonas sp. DEMB1]
MCSAALSPAAFCSSGSHLATASAWARNMRVPSLTRSSSVSSGSMSVISQTRSMRSISLPCMVRSWRMANSWSWQSFWQSDGPTLSMIHLPL